jgi:plasmid stability protein
MATLTIRNLPDDVRDRLRARAAQAGRSMEAEARAILTDSVKGARPPANPDERIAAWRELQAFVIANYRAPPGEESAVDPLLRDRRRENITEMIKDGDDPRAVFGDAFEERCAEAGWTPADVDALIAELRDASR